MRREAVGFLLGVLLIAPAPLSRAGETSVQHEIEASLMCYCGCANLSVRICTCGTAEAMRREIVDRLADGQSRDEVVRAFVDRHGEQILSAPEKSGFNLLAWIAPFGAVLAGAAALVIAVRRWSARAPGVGAGEPAAALTDRERKLAERMERELREEM